MLLGAVNLTDDTTKKVLKGTLRAADVKGVCRLLEDSLGADPFVLETTTATQAWAIEHFKTEAARLGAPVPMGKAFATIFEHGIRTMRDHYHFEPGAEWTTPLLLWIGGEGGGKSGGGGVTTYVVRDGELREASALEILRVDKNRTPVFFYYESERHVGFAVELEAQLEAQLDLST